MGTFATGTVTIDNAGGNVYALVPGDIVLLNSVTNKTYRNTETVNIASLQTGVVVAVQADELGSASSAAAGDVDAFVTPLLGLSVTNAASLVGTDPETDTALRARAMEKVGALSPNGPRDAYAYFAKSAVRANNLAGRHSFEGMTTDEIATYNSGVMFGPNWEAWPGDAAWSATVD